MVYLLRAEDLSSDICVSVLSGIALAKPKAQTAEYVEQVNDLAVWEG